jgi:hypothetical protein
VIGRGKVKFHQAEKRPQKPSVWRSGKWKRRRSVSPVSMARSEAGRPACRRPPAPRSRWPPGTPTW